MEIKKHNATRFSLNPATKERRLNDLRQRLEKATPRTRAEKRKSAYIRTLVIVGLGALAYFKFGHYFNG